MATELKLYNTLTRSKETFKPIDPHKVRMYVCGPTVYDFAHIGNARPVIVFDVLFRLLRHLYGEKHVTYVRNITDVDDKINARALRDFPELPLNEAIARVTAKTANQFHEDVKALGCLAPTHEPRATEHIEGMVRIIQQLLDRGHAYVASGTEGREVLFAVGSMPDYGQLSKRKLEDQQAGARVAVEAHKRNPGDFVLWKESASDQPGWPASFNENGAEVPIFGRPGWHIECSAMSKFHLGEIFDIHGGGLDLIFPHHENEIAQSRCAHGTDVMANVWMHNGFLQVEGRKMSKSEGNFLTISEILNTPMPMMWDTESRLPAEQVKRRWNGLAARYSMLQTHYREPIDWTARRFAEASNELVTWYTVLRSANFDVDHPIVSSADICSALSDDLSGWSAIGILRDAHSKSDVRSLGEGLSLLGLLDPEFLTSHHLLFERSDESCDPKAGLAEIKMTKAEIELQRDERLTLLAAKNFAEADRIRDELLAQGIQLKDSKDSVTGERVTTWEVKR
jgi:cysteinyl-tRNA synthetase